jgi:aspartyl-tRNA(Asn)/glutamyl-tRNA(Gln) amidotransferase subunit A
MSNALCTKSLAELAELIRTHAVSPVELTQAYLDRIEQLNPQLDAFITNTGERAMQQAKAMEAEIAAGIYRGPMHGMPFGLKDIYDTKGILTTAHSKTRLDNVPTEDATTTAKLYEAGGILLGKLATHEYAHGGPSFDLPWPPARNPWNREHFTGGSSSGSGAAVAAGFMPMAMGSDTGGSIRGPAALCGLVGLKPTYGLVSRAGIIANSFSYDHAGPLTWTVEDAAIALQILAGYDPHDPASANVEIPDYRAALSRDIRGLRVGVARHFHEGNPNVNPELVAAFEAALEVLRGLGAVIEDITAMRTPIEYQHIKVVTAESELLSVHEGNLRTRPEDFGDDFLGRVLPACLLTARDYLNSQRERRKAVAEMEPIYAAHDVIASIGPGPAPKLGAWRTIHFWQHGSITAPFNVTGGPALVQCIGYTTSGLPLAMQLAGRPFDEATVLRVGHAYEGATPWRERRPQLDPAADFSTTLPPVPEPPAIDCTQAQQDIVALAARRAGLTLDERQFAMVCAAAPYVDAIRQALARKRDWYEAPAQVFVSTRP